MNDSSKFSENRSTMIFRHIGKNEFQKTTQKHRDPSGNSAVQKHSAFRASMKIVIKREGAENKNRLIDLLYENIV